MNREMWCERCMEQGREILRLQRDSLNRLYERLDSSFSQAVSCIMSCSGYVITGGIGKAGLIGQKISGTLTSTGTRSFFLHPTEAMHGDMGRVGRDDVMLLLSLSGQTEELVRMLPAVEALHIPVIALTGNPTSQLARSAQVVLNVHFQGESGVLGLAPSSSTTAMLALGDALALVVSQEKNFTREQFARFHPAGALGRKLSRVEDYMRELKQCRLAEDTQSVRDVFISLRCTGRRTGAIMLTGKDGLLTGIFTDTDLARLFERNKDEVFNYPVKEVMTPHPVTVTYGTMMEDAVRLMSVRKISELPVVDSDGKPVGILDVTDVIALFPVLHSVN